MKGLGLAGAGVGAASLTSPAFHDLDELLSSPSYNKRPWWVKSREIGNPTTDIDWSMMDGSFDQRLEAHHIHTHALYIGFDEMEALESQNKRANEELANMKANVPGYSHPTYALDKASPGGPTKTWTGSKKVKSPEELGVPRWQGSPEENSKLLHAATRLWGASQIGISTVDSNSKKMHFKYLKTGSEGLLGREWPPPLTVSKEFKWVNEDVGYENTTSITLPGNKQMYLIGIVTPMSKELWRRSPSIFKNIANGTRGLRNGPLAQGPHAFLYGLGYHYYTHMSDGNDPISSPAACIMGGAAEMARQDNFCFTPEDGSCVGTFAAWTDIPLAPEAPIDAGMFKFCATCGKCAEFCPSNSISREKEPTWEIPLSRGKERVYHFPGKKAYWCDGDTCHLYYAYNAGGCGICYGTCSFNVDTSAMIHKLSKGMISTVPLFNGFLFNISKSFGYGVVPPEEMESWWDLSLPSLGSDTSIEAWDIGYNK